ncbi:hypothetical protein Salmuc_02893 [Salipiger mucosus DSM 16094]|uniref:Uncharacterized protein n=1 Tax=Salipiger mucosus DSM 16094 TaxID=1123237 RepID=S9Q4W3_9RHOB|nr:hypothetical protein Salmuc_02893 [Salipiger mucosus DSM 16094]
MSTCPLGRIAIKADGIDQRKRSDQIGSENTKPLGYSATDIVRNEIDRI